MQIINCWDIQTWDGGDRHNHLLYFSNEKAAREWKSANTHDLCSKSSFVIYDSIDEWESHRQSKLTARALSKLSAEERKALGY